MADIEFKSYIKEFNGDFESKLEKALQSIGYFVDGESKNRCPVLSGYLRNSIGFNVKANEKKVQIGAGAKYATYVFKGTYKQNAQPTIEPSVVQNKAKIESIIKNVFKA